MKHEHDPILASCPLCGAPVQVTLPNRIDVQCGHEDAIAQWIESHAGRRYVAEYLLGSGDDVESDPCTMMQAA